MYSWCSNRQGSKYCPNKGYLVEGSNMAEVTTPKIITLLDSINDESNGIFLPYIQRDFVWKEERIYALLDSLMRRYPIGSILTWQTKETINYRPFIKDYTSDYDFESEIRSSQGITFLRQYVIDGQQRLQGLYIACYGSYGGKELYFNVQSSPDDEKGYEFKFLEKPFMKTWVKVSEIASITAAQMHNRLNDIGIIASGHTKDESERITENATKLRNVFNDTNIPLITLTKDIGLNDMAEVFVRINTEGVALEKADLLMTIIKDQGMELGFEFNSINKQLEDTGFINPRDFVLKAFQAMLGMGTKLDLKNFSKDEAQNLLREKSKLKNMRDAICETLDFVSKIECIGGAKNVSSWNPVLLLVCYRYYQPAKWDAEIARNFLLFAFLSRAFVSVSAKTLDSLVETTKTKFGLRYFKPLMEEKNQKLLGVNADDLINKTLYKKDDSNVHIILRLLMQNKNRSWFGNLFGIGKRTQNLTGGLHIDHIFPIKLCKKSKIKAEKYHQLANLTLLSAQDNADKSDNPPIDWLRGRDLSLHFIPLSLNNDILNIENFDKFIKQRKDIMVKELTAILKTLGA